MKKKILLGILCFVMVISLTGCLSKEAITTSKFIGVSRKHNYILGDVTSQYETYGSIKEATVSQADGFQIEFYVFESEKDAKGMFSANKTKFSKTSGTNFSAKVGNYETFKLTNDDNYMYLCRVDNTLIYVNADAKYKDQIKEFINELGY